MHVSRTRVRAFGLAIGGCGRRVHPFRGHFFPGHHHFSTPEPGGDGGEPKLII